MKLEDIAKMIRAAMARTGKALIEIAKGDDLASILAEMGISDKANWKVKWSIEKFANDAAVIAGTPFSVEEFERNLLLNEGITEIWKLVAGDGTATAYNNANARIGIGDSATAAVATQTDLQAGANKLYKAMDATYPQVTGQTITFKSTFGATDANFAWNEITVDNGAAGAKNMNRKVQVMGTKANPTTWVVTLQITLA
ncbi:MAG: hypothetical protein WA118_08330 [Carboxydocellales bacterium]